MTHRKRRLHERFRSLYLWHRYAGLAAALLVIWLAVTGIVLNHADDLGLSGKFVRQEWLLSLYNIEAPRQLEGLRVGTHWVTQSGGRIYLDAVHIGTGTVVDAATADFGLVIGMPHHLRLYTPDGELIEEIPFTATRAAIRNLHASAQGIVITAGENRFLADRDFLRFTPLPNPAETPAPVMEPLPADLARRIATDILHHALDWERVLLDLHAGRIAGRAGKWLADAAGILLLLLALSGVIVWLQRRGRR